ncbi:MAG TPA: selenide, water dikinase SelD [Actinomycetes bacterium]|nr:selenide, water dikinase SelD [Actinomycetes bacterium]
MAASAPTVRLTSLSHGAGCACKLPFAALDRLLAAVGAPAAAGERLLVGLEDGDDAAVWRLDERRALVLTTDFFTPIVDDAAAWGRIAAANALSDVYAMGGRPLLALNLVAWPAATLGLELLAEVLRGGAEVAGRAGCVVAGGHSVDDAEPKYGLAVVGLAEPERLLRAAAARPGDALVLTKALGTGVIATAIKRGRPDPAAVRGAVESMTALNDAAAEAALAAGVRAATDVTGFGLLGHLHRLLRASGAAAVIGAAQVPLLPGAAELAAAGFVPGGTVSNTAYLESRVRVDPAVPAATATLLHDAQTSGGLLLAAAPGRLAALLAALRARAVPAATIGEVTAGEPGRIRVVPSLPAG